MPAALAWSRELNASTWQSDKGQQVALCQAWSSLAETSRRLIHGRRCGASDESSDDEVAACSRRLARLAASEAHSSGGRRGRRRGDSLARRRLGGGASDGHSDDYDQHITGTTPHGRSPGRWAGGGARHVGSISYESVEEAVRLSAESLALAAETLRKPTSPRSPQAAARGADPPPGSWGFGWGRRRAESDDDDGGGEATGGGGRPRASLDFEFAASRDLPLAASRETELSSLRDCRGDGSDDGRDDTWPSRDRPSRDDGRRRPSRDDGTRNLREGRRDQLPSDNRPTKGHDGGRRSDRDDDGEALQEGRRDQPPWDEGGRRFGGDDGEAPQEGRRDQPPWDDRGRRLNQEDGGDAPRALSRDRLPSDERGRQFSHDNAGGDVPRALRRDQPPSDDEGRRLSREDGEASQEGRRDRLPLDDGAPTGHEISRGSAFSSDAGAAPSDDASRGAVARESHRRAIVDDVDFYFSEDDDGDDEGEKGDADGGGGYRVAQEEPSATTMTTPTKTKKVKKRPAPTFAPPPTASLTASSRRTARPSLEAPPPRGSSRSVDSRHGSVQSARSRSASPRRPPAPVALGDGSRSAREAPGFSVVPRCYVEMTKTGSERSASPKRAPSCVAFGSNCHTGRGEPSVSRGRPVWPRASVGSTASERSASLRRPPSPVGFGSGTPTGRGEPSVFHSVRPRASVDSTRAASERSASPRRPSSPVGFGSGTPTGRGEPSFFRPVGPRSSVGSRRDSELSASPRRASSPVGRPPSPVGFGSGSPTGRGEASTFSFVGSEDGLRRGRSYDIGDRHEYDWTSASAARRRDEARSSSPSFRSGSQGLQHGSPLRVRPDDGHEYDWTAASARQRRAGGSLSPSRAASGAPPQPPPHVGFAGGSPTGRDPSPTGRQAAGSPTDAADGGTSPRPAPPREQGRHDGGAQRPLCSPQSSPRPPASPTSAAASPTSAAASPTSAGGSPTSAAAISPLRGRRQSPRRGTGAYDEASMTSSSRRSPASLRRRGDGRDGLGNGSPNMRIGPRGRATGEDGRRRNIRKAAVPEFLDARREAIASDARHRTPPRPARQRAASPMLAAETPPRGARAAPAAAKIALVLARQLGGRAPEATLSFDQFTTRLDASARGARGARTPGGTARASTTTAAAGRAATSGSQARPVVKATAPARPAAKAPVPVRAPAKSPAKAPAKAPPDAERGDEPMSFAQWSAEQNSSAPAAARRPPGAADGEAVGAGPKPRPLRSADGGQTGAAQRAPAAARGGTPLASSPPPSRRAGPPARGAAPTRARAAPIPANATAGIFDDTASSRRASPRRPARYDAADAADDYSLRPWTRAVAGSDAWRVVVDGAKVAFCAIEHAVELPLRPVDENAFDAFDAAPASVVAVTVRRCSGAAGDEPGDAQRCEAACVACLGVAAPRFVALVSLGLGPALGHVLEKTLANLPLRHLDLSGNCLDAAPERLPASLVSLNLAGNRLKWAGFLEHLVNLTALDLSSNRILSTLALRPLVLARGALKSLDVRGNALCDREVLWERNLLSLFGTKLHVA